jgi:hypothetical protein
MESSTHKRTKSIKLLLADGASLSKSLENISSLSPDEQTIQLRSAIKPFLAAEKQNGF